MSATSSLFTAALEVSGARVSLSSLLLILSWPRSSSSIATQASPALSLRYKNYTLSFKLRDGERSPFLTASTGRLSLNNNTRAYLSLDASILTKAHSLFIECTMSACPGLDVERKQNYSFSNIVLPPPPIHSLTHQHPPGRLRHNPLKEGYCQGMGEHIIPGHPEPAVHQDAACE